MPWVRADKIAAISLAVAAIALVLSGIPIATAAWERFHAPSISIETPGEDEQISVQASAVTGFMANIPEDRDVWLLVRSSSEGRWYPIQTVEPQPDGSWQSEADALQLTDPGAYTLYAYLADFTASAEMKSYLTEAQASGVYPGLPSPPEGTTLEDVKRIERLAAP
jgi:hypothetical protein